MIWWVLCSGLGWIARLASVNACLVIAKPVVVFTVLRTAVNSDFIIGRWHALHWFGRVRERIFPVCVLARP